MSCCRRASRTTAPHGGDRQHPVDQRRLQYAHDRHGEDQRRDREKDVGHAHQRELGVAPEVARDQPDRDAHRIRDAEHHHAQDQRDPVGVDDAAEEIAPDQIGPHQVRPARRLIEVGEVDHRAAMLGERRDEVREDGADQDDADQDQPEQRERVGRQNRERPPHDAVLE